jgi:hypothetical protein
LWTSTEQTDSSHQGIPIKRFTTVRIKKIAKSKDLRGSTVRGSTSYQAMPRIMIIKPQQATNNLSTINLHKY